MNTKRTTYEKLNTALMNARTEYENVLCNYDDRFSSDYESKNMAAATAEVEKLYALKHAAEAAEAMQTAIMNLCEAILPKAEPTKANANINAQHGGTFASRYHESLRRLAKK